MGNVRRNYSTFATEILRLPRLAGDFRLNCDLVFNWQDCAVADLHQQFNVRPADLAHLFTNPFPFGCCGRLHLTIGSRLRLRAVGNTHVPRNLTNTASRR
jgi:hypothetical protein